MKWEDMVGAGADKSHNMTYTMSLPSSREIFFIVFSLEHNFFLLLGASQTLALIHPGTLPHWIWVMFQVLKQGALAFLEYQNQEHFDSASWIPLFPETFKKGQQEEEKGRSFKANSFQYF